MARIKYILQAPEGVSEVIVDGIYYWPDADHRVSCTSEAHLKVLRLHGLVMVGQEDLGAPPAPNSGYIDHDEMGRSELGNALLARGLNFDRLGGRAAMVAIAEAYNASLAPAKAPEPDVVVEADDDDEPEVIKTTLNLAWVDPERVAEMSAAQIKAMLESAGVAVAPKTPPAALRNIARLAIKRAREAVAA